MGMLFLIPFGFWQVVSSLTMFFIYKDRKRVPHLIATTIWFTVFLVFKEASLGGALNDSIFMIFIPACIGLWYFFLTRDEFKYQKRKKELEEEREYV